MQLKNNEANSGLYIIIIGLDGQIDALPWIAEGYHRVSGPTNVRNSGGRPVMKNSVYYWVQYTNSEHTIVVSI